jgi:hypothetical protein
MQPDSPSAQIKYDESLSAKWDEARSWFLSIAYFGSAFPIMPYCGANEFFSAVFSIGVVHHLRVGYRIRIADLMVGNLLPGKNIAVPENKYSGFNWFC